MQNTPKDRVRIFARDGTMLAEFRAAVNRSWSLASEGRATFTYPTRHEKVVNEKNLQFGNYLLVENDTLPAWVGVIDMPRTWAARQVTVSAYTPERIFSWRIGGLETILNSSAGNMFETLVNLVNKAERTLLQVGEIYRSNNTMTETLHPTPLSEDLRRIQERSKENYRWRPAVNSDGRLVIYADWYQQLGNEYDVMLHEGKYGGNIEDGSSVMVEDGRIINYLLGYGNGAIWMSKPSSSAYISESVSVYGLRAAGLQLNANTVAGVERNVAKNIVKEYKPVRRFALNALNVGDTFKYIALGNRMNVQFQNMGFKNGVVGFTGGIRIIGMAYDPTSPNKINLVVEEWNG